MIIGPVLRQKNINTVNISFSDQKIQITFMLFFRHLDDDFRLFFFISWPLGVTLFKIWCFHSLSDLSISSLNFSFWGISSAHAVPSLFLAMLLLKSYTNFDFGLVS